MECIDNSSSKLYYKIGITKNSPHLRLKALSTGNPSKITLINSYKSEHYLKIERILHRLFKPKKEKGEWFNLSNEDAFSFIDECKKAEDNIIFLLENNSLYD